MLKNEPVTALLIHIVIILNPKCEVSSFNRSRNSIIVIIVIKAICNAQDRLKEAANALSGS